MTSPSESTSPVQALPAVEPTVSVIITCFNYGRYLPDAVESALAQTRPAEEIIIVDDGSTDNSLEIADRFARMHPKIRVIPQENRGPAEALNRGVQASTGTYFFKLDPDDMLDPLFIERTLPILLANPKAAYVYTCCRLFGTHRGITPAPPYDERVLRIRPYINANSLMRRRAFEEVGGYSSAMTKVSRTGICTSRWPSTAGTGLPCRSRSSSIASIARVGATSALLSGSR